MDRRRFLTLAGAALPGLTIAGRLYAQPLSAPRLLVVFLRGGYDCANLLVPYSSSYYYETRPRIAIARPELPADGAAGTGVAASPGAAAANGSSPSGALALDADWALAPAVRQSIGPLYGARQVLFVPFAGTDDLSRSHFETQDSIEAREKAERRPA